VKLSDSATAQWRAMVEAHQAQSQRLRDPEWRPHRDFAPPSVDSFRADRGRADDTCIVDVLRGLLPPNGTFVDVGAGAGRFAIPLARSAATVFAIEPSETMRAALAADAAEAGITNVQLIPSQWEAITGVSGDLVLASHVVYSLLDIEPFVRRLDTAARAWAAVLAFEKPPLSWLSGFWPRVHDEVRLPAPHLPQVIDVVTQLGFGPPLVDLIEVEPFDLGPPEIAREKLRRRLYVAPNSPADRRLSTAMDELLENHGGVLVPRTDETVRVGLARWTPRHG